MDVVIKFAARMFSYAFLALCYIAITVHWSGGSLKRAWTDKSLQLYLGWAGGVISFDLLCFGTRSCGRSAVEQFYEIPLQALGLALLIIPMCVIPLWVRRWK